MSLQWVQLLSAWLKYAPASAGYLLLDLSRITSLFEAYRPESFQHALLSALEARLAPYGVSDSNILMLDQMVLVALGSTSLSTKYSNDLFLEHIKAALSYQSVQCGSHRVLIHVLAAWIESAADIPITPETFSADLYSGAKAIAFAELGTQSIAQTRSDMAAASQFFDQVRDAQVVLAFQPVVSIHSPRQILHYEVLLRKIKSHDEGQDVSCEEVVQALERLHVITRLDASVLWTVVQTLEEQPDIQLSCNISTLSLQHSAGWRLLFSVLANAPGVARRLTLEITETAAVFDMEEAVALLKTLRSLGCKIAIDDMGTGFSTLELAQQIKPDIIKIDKTLVHAAREEEGSVCLQSLVNASKNISPCVVVEGVESETDLQTSIAAGAHAAQGYFIQAPDTQPPWGEAHVRLQDSFNPAHRSVAVV